MSSPLKRIVPVGDLVGGVGEEGVGEGGFPRAVGPHQHVDLGFGDREADPAQDLVVVDGDVKIVDLEQRVRGHGLRFYYHYRRSGNPAAVPFWRPPCWIP